MTSVLAPAPTAYQPKPALPASHPFTCNTCQVAFRNHDSQRTHYHTDWHQYNLKRKVATLPPLSSETFAEKVLHAQASTRLERERATFEKSCKICTKVYYSENAYANHVGSLKHRQNVATAQMNAIRAGGSARNIVSTATVVGQDAKDDKDETSSVACLFCPYVSPSLTLNVSHMTKAHGLFIPEASYLIDLAGLISYLGKKLVFGNQCLYCNKTKGGLAGIRTHMQDKGHTMLGFETEDQQVELGQYYNFESTYSDAGEESMSSDEASGSKKKSRRPDDAEEGWEAVEDGEGWETDSSASSLDSGILYHDDYELHLPSGRSVGHRSLAKYFRQNLRDHPLHDRSVRRIADTPYPQRALNRRERREEQRLIRRNGPEHLGVATTQQRQVTELTKKARDLDLRGRRRQEWGVDRKGNFQKHFRDPLLQ
ncbi:C2H2 type zinc-finger-domain-containing protein [Geopyxis carbonaria]|nr:C2H2 type zinc-finger-domain-containing protein [Geopyxis carbonaria]